MNHGPISLLLGGVLLSELLLLASGALLTVGVVAAVVYYKQIEGVRQEYQKAQNVVGDIVLSFKSELRSYKEALETVSHISSTLSSDYRTTRNKMKQVEKRLNGLTEAVNSDSRNEDRILPQIEGMNRKIESLARVQKNLTKRFAEVQKPMQTDELESKAKNAKIEAPIPIKKEKALAPLTETELAILQILADEGGKTSPEIRERIELTREHTARLMKKLYEEGYLERSTRKIPYTYRIKKEMLTILEK